MKQAVRTMASAAGSGRTFRRRLPPELGGCWFPASLEGGLKYLKRHVADIDPILTSFARDAVRPGSTAWDIGANVGLFTFAAAGLAGSTGRVLAVEADTWLAGNLRRAARWNRGAARTDVLPVAISDAPGVDTFQVTRGTRATSYLGRAGGSGAATGVRETQYVATLHLDALLEQFPAPDVLKIDVEGAEVPVLEGGAAVLERGPVLLVEVYEAHADAVHALLAPHGYEYVDARTHEPTARPTYHTIARVPSRARGV